MVATRRLPAEAAVRPAVLGMSARALAGLAFIDLIVYLISYYYVSIYYAHNVPHFDSIGSLTLMYEYINLFHREGLPAALKFALEHDSVSWVQGLFAVFLAPVLPRTPMALMALNFACLFAGQAALYDMSRRFGATPLQGFAFGLLPLLPDALFGHYGTYQDMRRDASFFGLLLAAYCLSLAYARQPTSVRGALLGLAAGLTVWARGNALPYLAIILLPAFAWGCARTLPARRWPELFRQAAPPLLVFAPLAGLYYNQNLGSLLNKYLLSTPDLNTSRWASLGYFASAPLVLLLGSPDRVFWVKLGLWLAGLPAGLFVATRTGLLRLRLRSAATDDRLWLVLGGAWVLLAVMILVTLVLGISRIAGYEPIYPILIGMFSLLIGLALCVTVGDGRLPARSARLMAVAGLLLFMFASGVDRLRLATYPNQAANVKTAQALIPVMSELARDHRVTWLWNGNLNSWVINYYLAQAGQPRIEFYVGDASFRLPSAALHETVESQLAQVKDMLLQTDAIILSDTPGAYAGVIGPSLFDTYGYRIVPEILAWPQFEQAYDFDSDGYHFVVLVRR